MLLREQIKKLRIELGLTQNELAEKLYISYQAVSQWENGNTLPDINLLPKLSEVLNVSLDELFGLKNKGNNFQPLIKNCRSNTLYVALIKNDELLDVIDLEKIKNERLDLKTYYDGDCESIFSSFNISVSGNINGFCEAGNNITCDGTINGPLEAGNNIECNHVNGSVTSGNNVMVKGNIEGDVNCGFTISCEGDINRNVICAGNVRCKSVGGDIIINSKENFKFENK